MFDSPQSLAFLKEIKNLALSLLGAMLTAAGLAFLQWIGAHIPEAVRFLSTAGGAYVAIKTGK